MKYYEMLWDRKVSADFVKFEDDWERYKFVAAPLVLLMDPSRAKRMEKFVRKGGTLLLTMRSGVKDEGNVCFTEGNLPFMLEELTGLTVTDYDCLIDGEKAGVCWKDNSRSLGSKWVDIAETKGATVLAEFSDGWYRGAPAVTCNRNGDGRVYYVATEPEAALQGKLAEEIISACALTQYGTSETGIEIVERVGRSKDFLFVMNHRNEKQEYTLNEGWRPVIELNDREDKKESLAAYETRVYWKKHGK